MESPAETVTIRAGTIADQERLIALGRDAFVETYGPHNRAEDMAKHVAQTYSGERIAHYLRESHSTYVVAEVKGNLAGYGLLCVNVPVPNTQDTHAAEIHHLYVLKQFQRLKLGSKIVDAMKCQAADRGCHSLWLGVWEKADWARRFYERVGFNAVGTHEFLLGEARQTDIVMSMSL